MTARLDEQAGLLKLLHKGQQDLKTAFDEHVHEPVEVVRQADKAASAPETPSEPDPAAPADAPAQPSAPPAPPRPPARKGMFPNRSH